MECNKNKGNIESSTENLEAAKLNNILGSSRPVLKELYSSNDCSTHNAISSNPVKLKDACSAQLTSTSITSEQNSCNMDAELGFIDDQHVQSHKTNEPKYTVTDPNESNSSEIATARNLNMNDGVKIKFEDGLIPTLTLAINEQEKCAQAKDSNTIQNSYLHANTESDTATSSDNETFAECQSYQMIGANKDSAFKVDYSFENSEIESYFSAANSRNITLINEEADPLSLTANKTQELSENIDDKITDQNTHQLDVTYEEEPMDVDISFSELKANVIVDHISLSVISSKNVNNVAESEFMTSDSCTKREFKQGKVQKMGKDKAVDSADIAKTSITEKEVNTESSESNVLLDGSIETSASTLPIPKYAQVSSDFNCSITTSGVKGDHSSTTKPTDSRPTSHFEELQSKKCIPETSKPLTGSNNALNNMSTSIGSCKSRGSSPSFPIKTDEKLVNQFPRSPTAIIPKGMTFLEKSEYTERNETERKKSVVSEHSFVWSYSRKTSTVDEKLTAPKKSENNSLDLLNSNECRSLINKDDGDKTNTEQNYFTNHTIVSEMVNRGSEDVEISVNDKRRTFNITSLHEKENKTQEDLLKEKRRTFNISAHNGLAEHPNSDEHNVPMDLEDTFAGGASVFDSHDDKKTLESATKKPPPIHIMQNQPENISPLVSSPPISTSRNSPESELAPMNKAKPALRNHDMDDDVFKAPLQPSPKLPLAITQRRPSIHAYKVKEGVVDILSEKEQTNRNASNEKDELIGNSTPSMEELPSSTCSSDNLNNSPMVPEDEQIFANEEFKSSNDVIFNPSDFDYLFTKGNNNTPIDRSSILLKFDPLLGVPVPVIQAKQQQPSKESQQILEKIFCKKPANLLSPTVEEDEHSSSASIGIYQSFVIKTDNKRKSFGINTSNQRTLKSNQDSAETFIETEKVGKQHCNYQEATLDKYASMSVDVIKDMNIDNDCNKSFENSDSQLDEKQINYKMGELEKKIKNEVLKTEDIEKKLKEAEQREEALIKRITDKDKTITKMTGVIEAYEKAIAELIAEKEQLIQNYERQLAEVKADRDSNYQHLTSLETTFADLHVKYGKSKEMTMQLKTNEEALVVEKRQILENLRLQEQRYDKMKNHAMQQLEIANKKLESLNKEHSIETTKLKALLKKEEISRASINEQLQQKSRENSELVKICDELINGQGS